MDVLVNNAGIMPLGRFVDEDDATARRMIDINVHGLMFGMKLVLPSMMRRNTGHIVNIASQAGKGGFPGGASYCATKHAVVGLSEAVRGELRDTDIEISCVMPAVVNTELGSGLVDTRAVKKLEPQEVADAIVDALKYPKFDVWVPKISNGIFRFMQLLPRSGRESAGARAQGRPGPGRRRHERAERVRGPGLPLGAGPRARGRRSGRGRRRGGQGQELAAPASKSGP